MLRAALLAGVDIAEVIHSAGPAGLTSCVLNPHPPDVDGLIDHLDCTFVGALLLGRAVALARNVLAIDDAIDPGLPVAAADVANEVDGPAGRNRDVIRADAHATARARVSD